MAAQQEVAAQLPQVRWTGRERAYDFLRRFARNKGAVVGVFIIFLIGFATIAAPLIVPYDPLDAKTEEARQGPTARHLMGTDEIGRDVLSRVVWGGRVSLRIGIIPVSIAAVTGTLLGLLSGYFGGLADTIIMRIIDIKMAFPGILLAVAIVAVLGPNIVNLMIAVGVTSVPLYTRLIRGSTLSAKQNLYVEAARALGCGNGRIILYHILPNVFAPLIVLMTLGTANAILVGSSLSFLGLGQQPPTPEWGSMLSAARRFLRIAWWMTVFPGLAISITVLSINLIGDGLRDALDPRLRV